MSEEKPDIEETEENGNGHDVDDEEDLVETCLERMADIAISARDGEVVSAHDINTMAVLHQFTVSAMAHFALEEFVDVMGRARDLIEKVDKMARMLPGAAMQGFSQAVGVPPGAKEAHGPPPGFTPPGPPPGEGGNGVSWLADVLAETPAEPAGVLVGTRTLAIEIDTGDHQPADQEHVVLLRRFQAEGWTLEQLNAELGKCERPAQARISKDPAKHA